MNLLRILRGGGALALTSSLLLGCEKEEQLYPPGLTGTVTASMGGDYRTALYFDLSTATFTQTVDHDLWSLSFDLNTSPPGVYLNSANFMFAKPAGDTAFFAVQDTAGGAPWAYDYPDGNPDRTAVRGLSNAEGQSTRAVYWLNLGFDEQGNALGIRKFQVLSWTEDSLFFRSARFDGTEVRTGAVGRRTNHRRSEFDLLTHESRFIEPERSDWDLLFTQYTDYDLTEEGDTLAYLVRGVLTDPDRLEMARWPGTDWDNIALSAVQDLNYSSAQNAIGYDWKTFSLDQGVYTVQTYWIYIIHSDRDGYFKLRFLDYYNAQGERGHAQFELRGL